MVRAPALRNTMEIPSDGNAISRHSIHRPFPPAAQSARALLARPSNPQTRIISYRAIMAAAGGPLCLCGGISNRDGTPSHSTSRRGDLFPPLPFLIIYGSASFSSPRRLLVIRCTPLKDSLARKRQIAFAPRSYAPSGVTPLLSGRGKLGRGTRTWLAGTNINRMKPQTRLSRQSLFSLASFK